MLSLTKQRDFRALQSLPFCYLCGNTFVAGDAKDLDHIPPESLFAKVHRNPLLLPTHVACNQGHSIEDEKIGQLISLLHGRFPSDPNNRRLKIVKTDVLGIGAINNIDIHAEIWRWVTGFHAALYQEPLSFKLRSIISPFAKANLSNGKYLFEPLLPQHLLFVETVKTNRVLGNVDSIVCNSGKMKYECVWGQSDQAGPWLCFFALDIYGWKELGATRAIPSRGCSGSYVVANGMVPQRASAASASPLVVPNYDPLDPFAP